VSLNEEKLVCVGRMSFIAPKSKKNCNFPFQTFINSNVRATVGLEGETMTYREEIKRLKAEGEVVVEMRKDLKKTAWELLDVFGAKGGGVLDVLWGIVQ